MRRKNMALGVVVLEPSTGTRCTLPWFAIAILELEVPKSIPQEILVIIISENLGAQFQIISDTLQFKEAVMSEVEVNNSICPDSDFH
ncbi:hypothetical protein LXL81_08620 [Dyadobacter sp. CY356]|nr:hypothetical protein [Dyadobacter sp. CY356]